MTSDALWVKIQQVSELSGHFRLRSGLESRTYFDKYQFECRPDMLRAIVERMSDLIPPGTELLAGLELGGVPLAAALSLETGLPCVFVRKRAKGYGTQRIVEGPNVDGKAICVIEDVITTGGQVAQSAEELRRLGGIVDHVVCVIWRRSTDTNPLAPVKVMLHSVFQPKVTVSPC